MKTKPFLPCALLLLAALLLGVAPARAVDFHVATAQELQNALTLAAANDADDNIYLTNGYYTGNFNFNSTEARNLTLQAEPGVTSDQVTIDGAGGGRAMNLTCSNSFGNMTVQGITFLRNCGDTAKGALRIAVGSAATISVSACRFLSPSNSSGMGLEIVSGQNASIDACTAIGSTTGGGGRGINIAGVSGNIIVQNSVVSTNRVAGSSGGGLSVGSGSLIIISNDTFTANSISGDYYSGTGNGGGFACWTAATLIRNTFTGNTAYSGWGNGSGGGAYCGSTATLIGNIFTGNQTANTASSSDGAGRGGGAYCSGTATLTGNTFTGNSATWSGGGGHCNSTATLTSNTITGNSLSSSGGGGGGIRCSTGTLTGNTFTGNSAGDSGGGLSCTTATLSNNTFTSNSATNGGGVACGAATLTANTFKQNTASQNGGAIYASGATITMSDNLVVKNSQSGSAYTGGGIWVNASATLNMVNNTITANTAAGGGGGVALQVSGVVEILNVFNNIIWGNTATGSGVDVYLAGTGQKKQFLFNDAHGMYGVWDIAVNNLDVDPQFFDPVNGDYHLRNTSACKDAGTNGAPQLPATDLEGGPRIANGTVDMGCYEFGNSIAHPADVNNDWVISDAEYTAYAAAWKNDQTWATAPNPIPADYVTRAGYLKQNGGAYHNDGSARPVCWKPGAN